MNGGMLIGAIRLGLIRELALSGCPIIDLMDVIGILIRSRLKCPLEPIRVADVRWWQPAAVRVGWSISSGDTPASRSAIAIAFAIALPVI